MRLAIILAGVIPALAPSSPAITARPSRFVASACPATPASLAAIKKVRCGYLTVPENRSSPNGRTIRLPVAIVPAAAAKHAPDPIVWMTGGPGYDAFSQVQVAVEWGLNRDRNVILMSQRGTYSSKPALVCPNIDKFNAGSVGLLYDAASTGTLHAQAVAVCRRELAARGIDLSAYNTIESAADYDDLRIALGFTKWNLWGMSYGTDLALTYLRLYPNAVRALGIDGIVPPDVAGAGMAWASAKEGIEGVFRACAAQPACNKRYPNLGATFVRLVRQLEAKPITVSVKSPADGRLVKVLIDGGVLVNWAVPSTHNAALLPLALDQLAHGRPQQIAQEWAARQIGDPKAYGDFAHGLTYGVMCSEWLPYQTAADILAAGRRAFPTLPDSVLAQGPQFGYLPEDCAEWNVPKAPASVRDATQSSVPSLVVSATFDAQTGAQWGPHAARTLSNATVVTIPGVAHMAVSKSNCAQFVITSFFDRPSAPKIACVRSLKPAPFKIGPSIR